MQDLKNAGLIWLKGGLFLAVGLIAALLVFLETPTLRTALLLGLAIWAFCRAYYFAFYVVERYLDPGYRFSGLGAFLRYLLRKKRGG